MISLLVLLQHDFRRFNDHFDGVALLKLHLLGAAPRDNAFDKVVSNADDDMSHDITKLNFFDLVGKLVACSKCHRRILLT